MKNRSLEGFCLADKPAGMGSATLVGKLRRELGGASVGHCGTLDRFASGLMALLAGRATSLADFLLHSQKEYVADFHFGRSTTTHDPEGETIEEWSAERTAERLRSLQNNIQTWFEALATLEQQRPPLYSALKLDGRRYSDRARGGESLSPPARPVRIFEAQILSTDWSRACLQARLLVSGGCYIRAIARDLGEDLQIPLHLGVLRRTRLGVHSIESPGIWRPGESAPMLQSAAIAVPEWPRFVVSAAACQELRHGRRPSLPAAAKTPGHTLLLAADGRVVAWIEGAGQDYRLRRVFAGAEAPSPEGLALPG
ncbi:MAG: tRNA pseudouridine(55) synthase TruB [Leptospirales bacterium]|nr:tRNA pseudouridine(55) synthase TruB [Leptospirales bacterium]